MATTIAFGDMGDNSDRRVTIEVIGGGNQSRMRVAKYTITVPYSCFAARIQSIHRQGGKITRITLSPFRNLPVTASHAIADPEMIPSPQPTESISPLPQPQAPANLLPIPVTPAPQPLTALNSGEYTFTEEW